MCDTNKKEGNMVYVIVKLVVKAECREEFDKSMQELVEKTNTEKGCLQYVVTGNNEDKNTLMLLEVWESEAHFHAHIETEHFKTLFPKVSGLCVEKPVSMRNKKIY